MQEKIIEQLNKLNWQYTIMIVLAYGAYSYLTWDDTEITQKMNQMLTSKSIIKSLQAKVDEVEKFEAELDDRKKAYLGLVKRLQQTQSRLPTKLHMPTILGEILAESKNVGLELNAIDPDAQEQDHQIYNSQGITLQARGTYIQFIIFFDRISRNERVFGVSSIVMNRDGESKVPLSGILNRGADNATVTGEKRYHALNGQFKLLAFRMDPEKIKAAIQRDREAGK